MSLLEVLVWIAVFSAAMLALSSSLLQFYRANSYTLQQAQAVSAAQRAIDRSIRVVREAQYSSQGAFPIISIGPDSFSFYADVDSDALIEKIRFFIEDSAFFEGVVDAAGDPPLYDSDEQISNLADHVTNLERDITAFHYYDESGQEITDYTDSAAVRFVTVDVSIDVNKNRSPTPLLLESSAALRNLSN